MQTRRCACVSLAITGHALPVPQTWHMTASIGWPGQGMSEAIESIETALITPDSVADEMCAVGLITGGMLLLHRGIVTLAPIRVRRSHCLSQHGSAQESCLLGVAWRGRLDTLLHSLA